MIDCSKLRTECNGEDKADDSPNQILRGLACLCIKSVSYNHLGEPIACFRAS